MCIRDSPQVVGNEGGVASGFGQLPFVEGEHDKVAEIEVTRLQHPHYLHADGGFSVEGNVGRGKQAVQQSLQRVFAHTTQFAGLYQAEPAVDEGVAFEQRLAVPVSYTHLDVYKRQPLKMRIITGFS